MLPFCDGIFRGVHSGVALPYMHVPLTLAEIARVLQPGGSLRLALHLFQWRLGIARHANLGGLIFFAYVCLNSLLLRWLGRQFRFLGQCESVQTEGGMRRLLSRAGFEHVRIDRGRRRFVVTATLRA